MSSGPSPPETGRTVESVPDSTSGRKSLVAPPWCWARGRQPVVELLEASRVHSWGQSVIPPISVSSSGGPSKLLSKEQDRQMLLILGLGLWGCSLPGGG